MARDLPSGTVTFLFTDVEGSTKLLHSLGDTAYAEVLAEHRRLLRAAFATHDGVEVDTQGDAFFVAFGRASDALAAAREGLEALTATPVVVRVGVHTGKPLVTDEGYVGEDVHRAARIAASGHGGQVLVSETTAELVDAGSLTDLGVHRFKDLARPERVFQLGDGPFPPIRSLSPSNLPVPATPFLGREDELARVGDLLSDDTTRLVTLTGPGGTGKTRLAIQAAAEASDGFPGGLWWVPLAPVADPSLIGSEIAEALGVEGDGSLVDGVHTRSGGRRTLLVLDNAEHLLPRLADEVAPLTRDGATLLVTSRERLHLEAEREFRVPALTAADAETFLIERAQAVGVRLEPSAALRELADRLDRLPLAMQLAVARLRLFSVEQLLERLSTALDLAGERDADPRQRTLRATIAWSYDLLDEDERRLFRRMSVFAGGATIDAVEAIGDADADVLLSLVDKSLVRRRDDALEPRFWMLETIRGFAHERLVDAGDLDELRLAHARWFAAWARAEDETIHDVPDRTPVLDRMSAELDNVRSALSVALERKAFDLVEALAGGFRTYWHLRGLYREGRRWLELAYEHPGGDRADRIRVLDGLSSLAYRQGEDAFALQVAEEALPLAQASGSDRELISAVTNVGDALSGLGRLDEAIDGFSEAVDIARRLGEPIRIAMALVNRGDMATIAGRYEDAITYLREAYDYATEQGVPGASAVALIDLANASFMLGRDDDAERFARDGAHGFDVSDSEAIALLVLAGVAQRRGETARAARYLGASDGLRERSGYEFEPAERAVLEVVLREMERALGDPLARAARAEGAALDDETARALVEG